MQLCQSPTCMPEANGAAKLCDGPILRNRLSDKCHEEGFTVVPETSENPRPLVSNLEGPSTRVGAEEYTGEACTLVCWQLIPGIVGAV